MNINSTLRLRLTCTTLNVRCGLAVHNKINEEQETPKMVVKKKTQETRKMFEFTAKNIRNGNIRNYLVPARKIKLSAWRPNWRFLTPDAHCTYYYNGQLPVDIILGIPHVGRTADTEEFAQNTRNKLQIAFELARRNLTERVDKQAENNAKLQPYPVFQPGQGVPVYRPYQGSDGPNPKLVVRWRVPYVVCSQVSPVVYRVRSMTDTLEVSVHLAHI